MEHTLTFYSVSQVQVDYLLNDLVSTGGSVNGDVAEAKTVLGPLKVQVDFNSRSGQLAVTVLEKPLMLTVNAIENAIRQALADAPVDTTEAAQTEPPADPVAVQPVPEETPSTMESSQTEASAARE